MHSLVLNRNWSPVHVTNWKRSVSLLYTGHANAIDQDFKTYDFQSWIDISKEKIQKGESRNIVRSVSLEIVVPDVVTLMFYDKLPPQEVLLTRESIFLRDKMKCGYCGRQHKRLLFT